MAPPLVAAADPTATRPIADAHVLVLLAGELRFSSATHLRVFAKACRGISLYIITYTEYHESARQLLEGSAVARLRLVNRSSLPVLYHSLYQWRLLHQAILEWRTELHTAPIVLRHRTDVPLGEGCTATAKQPWPFALLSMPKSMPYGNQRGMPTGSALMNAAGTAAAPLVFANTDRSFYADGPTFTKVFADFWPEALKTYSRRQPRANESAAFADAGRRQGLGNRTGCHTPGTSSSWHYKTDPIGWRYPRGYPGFRSEAAFAYHLLVRHGVRCMRICECTPSISECEMASVDRIERCKPLMVMQRQQPVLLKGLHMAPLAAT